MDVQPATNRRRRAVPLFGASLFFLVIAGALGYYAISTFQADMADGQDNGGAGTAGFVFMVALMPGFVAVVLFIVGCVVVARRRP
jgi:TRAP-type mannitol/chloroaromatic compound transport system permease small subunit